MKTIFLTKPFQWLYDVETPHLLFLFLMMLWFITPGLILHADQTAAMIDQGIWQLILLSLITFMLVIGLCWWLIRQFWTSTGLPELSQLITNFKSLTIWQQLGFLWASFALLLLAAIGSLIAIC